MSTLHTHKATISSRAQQHEVVNQSTIWAPGLFDHGWLVHVVDQPEHLRQAVLTACAAGMVAIVVASSAEDVATVAAAAPAGSVVRVEAEEAERDDPARGILRRLVHRDEPLTGGAGI